ncbi:uncharacterized protein LOC114401498 [Glycine soja]|nr:uncharacterized protein LOC114401498 [Glycine soja]
MDQKDKHAVSDHHGWVKSCKKEKMKQQRSLLLGSCQAELESPSAAKSPSRTVRECNICGKVFSSGKALGGHRRSHFQKHQKKVKVRFTNHSSKEAGDTSNNINRASNCDYDADDDGKRVCCICKKEFPTKNALFGHMRSHPERSWRGVSPPTHFPNKNSSSSSSLSSSFSFSSHNSDSMEKNMEEDRDDYDECVGVGAVCDGGGNRAIDLSTFTCPSWLKTDVRGRKCIGAYEAAETLAYLSVYSKYFCGESNGVSPKKDEVRPKSAPPLIKLGKRKINFSGSSSSKKHEVKKIKFYLKGELKIGKRNDADGEDDDDEDEKLNRCKGLSESEVEDEEGFDNVITEVVAPDRMQDDVDERKGKRVVDHKGKNIKKLVLKSMAKEKENEKVGGYKCGACGKIFSTFQGLGGHRSVHKGKNNNTVIIMDESNHNHSEALGDQENNSSSSSNMHKVDEAPLPTDETRVNEEIPETPPLLADEACQSSLGVKKLDFDLNELPCAMED